MSSHGSEPRADCTRKSCPICKTGEFASGAATITVVVPSATYDAIRTEAFMQCTSAEIFARQLVLAQLNRGEHELIAFRINEACIDAIEDCGLDDREEERNFERGN